MNRKVCSDQEKKYLRDLEFSIDTIYTQYELQSLCKVEVLGGEWEGMGYNQRFRTNSEGQKDCKIKKT